MCAWRKEQVFERLPRLKFALAQSEGYQRETDPHIAMYYYMHASLFLWNGTPRHPPAAALRGRV